mgnify:FL=1
MKAKILSTFDYDITANKLVAQRLVDDFILKLKSDINLLLPDTTLEESRSYVRKHITKSIAALKNNLPILIEESTNIPVEKLKSEIIDIKKLVSLPNEVKDVKAGDVVYVIYAEPCYGDKSSYPCKRYILEFKVLSLDFLGHANKNPLGITSHESPFGGMIDIEWCEHVVKKETYEKQS